MTLYHNPTDGPVVVDAEGRVLPGGDSWELAETEEIARAVGCGRLVDVTALHAELDAAAPAAPAAAVEGTD